jgi:protein gp37
MSDTFHADAPADSLRDLADEIRALDRDYPGHPHVIMLLTKRPENAVEWQRREFPDGLPRWVWIGCTVEHQLAADERIPHLLRVAAPVRFLSCEPLLGRVDLTAAVGTQWENGGTGDEWRAELWACPRCGGSGYHQTGPYVVGCYECNGNRTGIGWVIVGSESGQRRRPTDLAWVRSLRDQCQGAGVPFFAKQLDVGDGLVHAPVLDGRQHLEFPNG